MILGIDEAGKGPVIGSMFVVGVYATSQQLSYLKNIGIKDSKKLSSKKREELYVEIIKNISNYYMLEISANLIDNLRKTMSMNEIMVYSFSNIILQSDINNNDIIVVDAADISEERFKLNIMKLTSIQRSNLHPIFISKHKADSRYLVVSAASIIAKVERDKMIENLRKEFNLDLGSGYPSDSKTVNFLKYYSYSNKKLNNNIRMSWNTTKKYLNNIKKHSYIYG